MGRTVEPRSWRSQPATEASASLAEPSTSSGQWLAFRSRDTATTSWSSSSASVSGSSSALAIDQLRRSVLPASIPDAQNERINTAPWRVGTSTTSVSGLDRDSSSSRHIARPSGASWHAASNDNGDLPDSSSMLPPRLGTPVPRANNSNRQLFPTLAAPLSPAPNVVARPAGPSLDETLTSIGRRALARHRLSILESDSSGDQVSTLVHALNLETLERAQLAVEGSRIALEQARLAIRVALRNSETRLGRLAELIRMQLENDTSTPLPSVPRSSEEAEIEADRNEYNLERSLANLRAASQEIDRVLAGSRANSSSSAENAATSHVATSSFSSSTLSHGDFISRPPQSFSALARASLPDDSTRLRSTRSSISIVPSDPRQAVPTEQSTRQPTPRRPIRYLRASQIASSGTPRLRSSVQDTITSRLARPPRSTSSRNVGVQASSAGTVDDRTSNLARNVLSDLSQRTLLSDDEAHLLSDEDEVTSIGHPPPSRPASQQVGRWIRLDANGDEIHGEHAAAGAVPLGWSWAIRPGANDEPEKIGSSDHTGNADISGNTSSRRAAIGVGSQFSEELIGR